jgi:UDP-glucose 4-epimerase
MDEKVFSGKKVLVTGGFGLVGSNLARRLVSLGANVSLFVRNMNDSQNVEDVKDKVEMIKGDVRDYSGVESVVRGKDYIFHMAGQSSVVVSMEDPFLDLDVNARGTLNILEACRKHNKNARIVAAGTVRQVGIVDDKNLREGIRENPTSLFDLHKLVSEKYLEIYHKVYGLATTTLRFSNVYGEGQKNTDVHRSMINYIVKKGLSEKKLQVYGDGGPLRDYNHVENIVDACLAAVLSENTKGKHYVLGSGESKTFKDFLDSLVKLAEGKDIRIDVEKIETPEMVSKTVQGDVIIDSSKFREDSGWEPNINFEEGLRRVLDYYYK